MVVCWEGYGLLKSTVFAGSVLDWFGLVVWWFGGLVVVWSVGLLGQMVGKGYGLLKSTVFASRVWASEKPCLLINLRSVVRPIHKHGASYHHLR